MRIKYLLENNYYTDIISKIPKPILNFDTGDCTSIRTIPDNITKLFEGVEIYNPKDETKTIILNFDYFNGDDEFLPLYVQYLGIDGYISVEIFYNKNLEIEYITDFK